MILVTILVGYNLLELSHRRSTSLVFQQSSRQGFSSLVSYIGHDSDQPIVRNKSPLEEKHDVSDSITPHFVSYRQKTTRRKLVSRRPPGGNQNDHNKTATSLSSENSSLIFNSQHKFKNVSLKQPSNKYTNNFKTLQDHTDVATDQTHTHVSTKPLLHGEQKGVTTKMLLWHMIAHYKKYKPDYVIPCGDYQCVVTSNRSYMAEADVVIVDTFLLSRSRFKYKPVRTSPNQAFVFFTREPWQSYASLFPQSWDGVFNWTLTYQGNSDIHIPYSEVMFNGESKEKRDWSAIMKKKTQSVFWLVSNCKSSSKRMEYVDELKKHIDVHIVGKCGAKTCNQNVTDRRKDDIKPCYEKSRFYLAFENSFCQDYVTEKFYKTFQYNIIPIVRGKANYSKICPSDLFIDTADYNSPKELAGYLKYLQQNETAYLGYLKRRAQYSVGGDWLKKCQVCSFSHNLEKHRRSYPSISSWVDACDVPKQPHLH